MGTISSSARARRTRLAANRIPGPVRAAALLLASLPAWAAGGGGERIVLVADSRRFSGWLAWWTNLYNESHLWFAVVTVVAIPALGLVMGRLTGLLLARTGINLKSRVLAEH
jgi:hypothetical protein